MKKTTATIEQWKDAANLVLRADRSLQDLSKHPAFRSLGKRRVNELLKAISAIDLLRSKLDGEVCAAFPDADDSILKVFYPGAGVYHNEDSVCRSSEQR